MGFTQYFILTTIVVWIVYDIFIYLTKGNVATESATTWRFAYILPSIPWTVGVLLGHLFLQNHAPGAAAIPIPAHYGEFQLVILILSLLWIGLDFLQYSDTGIGCAFSEWLWTVTGHMTWIPLVAGAVTGAIFFQMHEATALALNLLEVSARCT